MFPQFGWLSGNQIAWVLHEIILDHRACVEFCALSPVEVLSHINSIILLIVYFVIL